VCIPNVKCDATDKHRCGDEAACVVENTKTKCFPADGSANPAILAPVCHCDCSPELATTPGIQF
jgi:hypothetical protein